MVPPTDIAPTERITADYARVSDDDRGGGEGVESQHRDSEEFADEIGRPLAATYQDNSISAFTGRERPEYQRLLADVARGRIGAVVIWHADRLARTVREGLDIVDLFREHDVRLYSVQKGGEYLLKRAGGRAEFIADINAAEKESGHKGERVVLARKRQARTGAFGGGVRSFGWGAPTGRVRSKCVNPKAPLDERVYVDVPVLDMGKHRKDEADEIRTWAEELLATRNMAQLLAGIRKRGVKTVTETDGRKLRRHGRAAKHGGWNAVTVWRVLTSPRVSGHATYRGQIIKWNAWPEIVPEETRQALIALRNDPSRVNTPGNTPKWLISKSADVKCGPCETAGRLTVHYKQKGPVYRCGGCGKGNQLALLVDEYVSSVAVERLSRDDLAELIKPPRPEVDLVGLRAEITELQRRKREAGLSFARGGIDLETLETVKADTDQQISRLRGVIAEATAASPLADFLETGSVEAAAAVWEALSIGRRREIVRLLMDVTVFKGRPHELDPDTILITPKRRQRPRSISPE